MVIWERHLPNRLKSEADFPVTKSLVGRNGVRLIMPRIPAEHEI